MPNPVVDFNANYKKNFTDAVAAGANPVDCFNKVLTEAGLDDAAFQACPFGFPLTTNDKWFTSLDAQNKPKATIYIMLLIKLGADKKIDASTTGPLSQAKTIRESMDKVRTMLAPPVVEEKSGMSTVAAVGVGVGVVAILAAITYHMTKPKESVE